MKPGVCCYGIENAPEPVTTTTSTISTTTAPQATCGDECLVPVSSTLFIIQE